MRNILITIIFYQFYSMTIHNSRINLNVQIGILVLYAVIHMTKTQQHAYYFYF